MDSNRFQKSSNMKHHTHIKPPIPLIGLGTYRLQGAQCTQMIKKALELGYRHLDTALLYENHRDIAQAIYSTDIDPLFITSKIMPYHLQKYPVTYWCEHILKELKIERLNLLLLHYPDRSLPMESILIELSSLIDQGKIQAMGVSNFTIKHLQDIMHLNLPISVNQVEFHPYLYQKFLYEFCLQQGIQLVSFRPLGKGSFARDPLFEKIGECYGKTAAQICLRWLVQKHIPTIPQTTSTSHLKENIEIFDFQLSDQDMNLLNHTITRK